MCLRIALFFSKFLCTKGEGCEVNSLFHGGGGEAGGRGGGRGGEGRGGVKGHWKDWALNITTGTQHAAQDTEYCTAAAKLSTKNYQCTCFYIWRLDLMILLGKIHYLGHWKGWAPNRDFLAQMALVSLIAISGPKKDAAT